MYNLGQFIYGESIIHRLDPRVKILSVMVLSLMILQGTVFTTALITAFLLILIPLSHLCFGHVLKALRPMAAFFILLFLLHLFFSEGVPIPPFPIWRVTITYEGLSTGTLILWQFMLLLACASVLTMTTSPSSIISAIEKLLRPLRIFRIPSHDLALMVSLALRFVPTLLQEMDRIKEAQMARGARFESGSLLQRMKMTTRLLLPLILSSFLRAAELATAMEARGYRRGPRTYMQELYLSRRDYIAAVVVILVTGVHLL